MRRRISDLTAAPALGRRAEGFDAAGFGTNLCLRQADAAKSESGEAFPQLSATVCGARYVRGLKAQDNGRLTEGISRRESATHRAAQRQAGGPRLLEDHPPEFGEKLDMQLPAWG